MHPRAKRALRKRYKAMSERQTEVALLVRHGMSNKVIGMHLGISEHTVKHHLQAAFDAVGCHSRLQLAVTIAQYVK